MDEFVTGIVEEIIYRNEDNGYTILNIDTQEELLTLVGNLFHVLVGEKIEARGSFSKHNIYGLQFNVTSFVNYLPETNDSIRAYLASGAIKGVKKVLAKKIVDRFGDETYYILENDPLRLKEVRGISLNKARDIGEQFQTQIEMRNAFLFLAKYNISYNFAVKIFKKYKNKCYDIIKDNPYILADDIEGISFKKADEIAHKMGLDKNSEFRIGSCIKFILNNSLAEGDIFLSDTQLLARVVDLINVSKDEIENSLISLSLKQDIVIEVVDEELRNIYLTPFYNMEKYIALKLLKLKNYKGKKYNDIEGQIESLEDDFSLNYELKQKECIYGALSSNVLVITGGPGTGKTTTLDGILRVFNMNGIKTFLAAPTGRAAKRMTEATGYEAKTIHRMLEVTVSEEKGNYFNYNEENKLPCEAIVVDEVSMLDTWLFFHLLKAVSIGTKIILVGDKDQLPSVGAGNVLNDVIKSGLIKTIKLDVIFRQKEESDIVSNAHKINNGEMISLSNKSKDFFVINKQNSMQALSEIISLSTKRLPKFLGSDDIFDIQVLSPMKKGILGIENLNEKLQASLNPPSKDKSEKKYRNTVFRVGDKVMQIKNNYDIKWKIYSDARYLLSDGEGVFNGDIGTVTDINFFNETLTVLFDDSREVDYKFSDLDELTLSYSVTVHKSQGSEYKCVIIPLFSGPPMLLTRNLLYTAVTRAKTLLVLVGDPSIVKRMIDNNYIIRRNSSLDIRIREFEDYI